MTTRQIRCSSPWRGLCGAWDHSGSHACDGGWGKSKVRSRRRRLCPQRRTAAYRATLEEDAELPAIFERTYGPTGTPLAAFRPVQSERPDFDAQQRKSCPNICWWIWLQYHLRAERPFAKDSLEAARHKLMDILCNYQGYQKSAILFLHSMPIVCRAASAALSSTNNIRYGSHREAETADMFIEHVTHEIGKGRRVRVATRRHGQIIILGYGALRVSARMFHEEVQNVEKQIRKLVQGEA